MDPLPPDQLKAAVRAFLLDSPERAEHEAAEGLTQCEPEVRVKRDEEGRVTEVRVILHCRTRQAFERFMEPENAGGPWRGREAFFHVKSAVAAVLGKQWKLAHFDFVASCTPPKQRAGSGKETSAVEPGPRQGEPPPELETEAMRVFELIRKLDEEGSRDPSVLRVFRMYCLEELTTEEISRKCKCATGTVSARLKHLREVTGLNTRTLKKLSGHIERIGNELSDPRARRIDRRGAMDQPGDDEPE